MINCPTPPVRELVLVCLLAFGGLAPAQTRTDGRIITEKPGLALIKPQAWSNPGQASVLVFEAFSDRRARGNDRAGYLVFRLPGGKTTQIDAAQVVDFIAQPDVPAELQNDAQAEVLRKTLAAFEPFAAKGATGREAVQRLTEPVATALERYEKGEVLIGGIWKLRSAWKQDNAKDYEARLKNELHSAKSKRDFELESNPLFVELLAISATDAALRARLTELQTTHQKLASVEEQTEITNSLKAEAHSPGDASALVSRLRALPYPDPQTTRILAQATDAEVLRTETQSVAAAVNTAFAGDAAGLPDLSGELSTRIDALAAAYGGFRAGLAPVGLWIPSALFSAVASVRDQLPRLKSLIASAQVPAALEILQSLGAASEMIGPQCASAMASTKAACEERLAKFTECKSQAVAIAAGGDKKAALAKWQECYALVADPAVATQIEELSAAK